MLGYGKKKHQEVLSGGASGTTECGDKWRTRAKKTKEEVERQAINAGFTI